MFSNEFGSAILLILIAIAIRMVLIPKLLMLVSTL